MSGALDLKALLSDRLGGAADLLERVRRTSPCLPRPLTLPPAPRTPSGRAGPSSSAATAAARARRLI